MKGKTICNKDHIHPSQQQKQGEEIWNLLLKRSWSRMKLNPNHKSSG